MAGFRKVDPNALLRLLEESGIDFRTTKRSYVFTCPRCNKSEKLMMFRNDGRFICWICAELNGFKGRPEYALSELLGMTLRQVQEKIYGTQYTLDEDLGFSVNLADFFEDDEEVSQELIQLTRGIQYPLDFYPIANEFSLRGRSYLDSRGIPVDIATAYDIRYCPVQQRVIFPIKVGEKLLGWQARAIFKTRIEDEETGEVREIPKILTTGRRDTLMFQDRLAGSDHAILCEGPVDALKCHLVGGNVASMGKVVGPQQLQIIRGSGVKRLYLGLDPDAATETMRIVREIGWELEMYRLLPAPGFKDLGEMTMEGVAKQFYHAPRVLPGQLFLHLG